MKQRISKLLTLAIAALALALASCITDIQNSVVFGEGEGDPVTIAFNPLAAPEHATPATRAYHDEDELGGDPDLDPDTAPGREPEDVEIVDIRVLLYKASTGQFVAQDDAQGFDNDQPVELELVTGTYDVVLVANSTSDTRLTGPGGLFNATFTNPNDYNTLNKVKNALLDSRAFDSPRAQVTAFPKTPIPMFALVRDVHISLDGSVRIADGTPQNTYVTPWAPVLERVGVRLSMEITLNPYQYADWVAATDRKIEISNLPGQSWLWQSGKFNGGLTDREATARVYTASANNQPTAGYDGYTIYVPAKAADPGAGTEAEDAKYLIRYDRIIVPELLFSDTDASDYAAVLSIDMGDDLVLSGRISGPDPDTSDDGYTLPRNLWLHLDVGIAGVRLEVIPKVIPWNATDGGGNIDDTDWLRARGPVYIANVWPQTFDAVTNLDNVQVLIEEGNPKVEYFDPGTESWAANSNGWLIVTEAATTTPGTENGEATQTRTVTVRAKADNTGKYQHARVKVVAADPGGERIEKWVEVIHTSGVPVPAGIIGYVAEGPEYGRLTLRGSREYATPVYNGQTVFSDAALEMFPDEGGLEPVTVYAAYFKWGSLVATSSELTDDSFYADDIVAAPEDFNNIGYPTPALDAVRALIPEGGGTSVRWGRVPFRDLVDAYDNRWKSEPDKGLGDPCAYYFKDWRMPLGGASNRDDTPVNGWNGGTFGTAGAGGDGTPNAARGVAFAADELGPGIPGGRRAGVSNSPLYPVDWTMFLPFTGSRLAASGRTVSQGFSGGYWSSTPRDDWYGGYYLAVQASTSYPAHEQEYETAFAVRCIDTNPPMPPDRRIHAAPGVIGYWVDDSDEVHLTLNGSSAYKGTEVEDAAPGPLEDVPVYVAYFKWGSVIATDSEEGVFSKDNVIYGPDGYDLGDLKNNTIGTKTGTEAWAAVPSRSASGFFQWLNVGQAQGYGDPCATYFDGWMLPTGGGITPASVPAWAENAGYQPFGKVTFSSWPLSNGADWIDRSSPTYGDFPNNGAVAGMNGAKDWSMFVPAAGRREFDDGELTLQSSQGRYWSSIYTWTLRFDNDDVSSYNEYVPTPNEKVGLPIRCVQTPPEPGLPVGMLAAPGMIGYIADGPRRGELTLRGSKEYANNTEIRDAAKTMFPATDDEPAGVSTQTVYVAYFKFGSLVAISSDATDSSRPSFESDDIIAAPVEWKGSLEGARTAIDATWGAIPVYTSTDWNTISKRNVSDPSYHSETNIALGKGDPCMYYFGNEYGGGWRLPVGGAFNDSYEPAKTNGGWNAGTFGKGNYSAIIKHTDAHSTWFDANKAGTDIPAGIRAGDGTSGYPADWTMFLPAAGMRLNFDGLVSNQGDYGYFWTSTAYTNRYGHHMVIYNSYVGPTGAYWLDAAFAVRCVSP